MVDTKAPWFRPPDTRPRADPAKGPQPKWWGPKENERRKRGREKRKERRKPVRPIKPYPTPGRSPRVPRPEAPVERAPRPVSPTPARAPRVPRVRLPLGGAAGVWGFVEYFEPWFAKRPVPLFKVPGGWIHCCGPSALPLEAVVQASVGNNGNSWCGACGKVGQAISGTTLWDAAVITSATTRIARVSRRNPPGGGGGFRVHDVWYRPTSPQNQPGRLRTVRTISMPGYGAPDPNIVRASPASMPVGDPLTGAPSPLVPGFGTPVTGPAPFSNPDLAYQPDYAWGFQIAPDVTEGQGNTPSVPSGPSVPSRPTPIRGGVKREPPKRGEKQRKVITRSAQIGIALFRALDAISESAEVVDALFEALPEDVQKRWKRAHADDGEYRRLLDTAGQYGIDGADWKLQALYYNWHLLDVEQGLKNILKNALSDRIVGGIQRELPRNTGNALSQSEMELNEWLDWAFSTGLGL